MPELDPELTAYLRDMIAPGEAQGLPDAVFVYATKGYDWSQHENESVHGILMESALDALDEIAEAHRALKPGGHLLLVNDPAEPTGHTGACYAEDAGFEVRDCIMVADSSEDQMHYVPKASRREREEGLNHLPLKVFGMSGGAQGAIARGTEEGGVETPPGQDIGLNRVQKRRNVHPTVKPYAVMERLLADVPKEVGPVVDPFMGSGTTGIACVRTGHDFIGIEREREYLTIAEGRVRHWNRRDAGWNTAEIESDLTEITDAQEEGPPEVSLGSLFGW
jgi:DNA modification methylase